MGMVPHIIAALALLGFGVWRCWDFACDGPVGLLIGVAVLAICTMLAAGIVVGGVFYAVFD